MKISIIGTGYVGLVSAVGLAELGHQVWAVNRTPEKIAKLQQGELIFFEPGLDKLLRKNLKNKRLYFTTDFAAAVNNSDFVFICVGTPPKADGSADLSAVKVVAGQIAQAARKNLIVINKSTVPVGTGRLVEKILKSNGHKFEVVSCPEFLREGRAVYDFLNPDRIVVGATKQAVGRKVMSLFAKLKTHKVVTTRETAELIKYAANAFLATKISFINEIANVCEKVGANVEQVAQGIGLDKRINPYFLKAGIGYGGSCFPKDVKALKQIAGSMGYDFKLLKAVIEVNNGQRQNFINKIKKELVSLAYKNIAVLGLAFKDNTDDIRESAAIDIVRALEKAGATIKTYDPEAMATAKRVLSRKTDFCDSAYAAAAKADALVIATEWPAFAGLNWAKVKQLMKGKIIFDGKNLLDQAKVEKLGFKYFSVGK